MVVLSYSVIHYIYIPGALGPCFHYCCSVYGICKWWDTLVVFVCLLFVDYTISLSSCVLYLIIIIKSEVWIINHCLWLGHEIVVCAVSLTMFFSMIAPGDVISLSVSVCLSSLHFLLSLSSPFLSTPTHSQSLFLCLFWQGCAARKRQNPPISKGDDRTKHVRVMMKYVTPNVYPYVDLCTGPQNGDPFERHIIELSWRVNYLTWCVNLFTDQSSSLIK